MYILMISKCPSRTASWIPLGPFISQAYPSFKQTWTKKKVELETVEVNNINLLSKPRFIFNYYVCVKNVGV